MIVYEKGKPKARRLPKIQDQIRRGTERLRQYERGLKPPFSARHPGGQRFRAAAGPDHDGRRTRQVNIALEVLEEMDLAIPVCGMVKDDKHRTRGLYFRNVEIPIDRNSEGFKLITRVQDEAHRFAIEYHRLLRSKCQVHSILDDIPGIS